MNSLLSRALELQRMAHELMYLDTNGSPIYSDEFCRLNKEVLTRSDSLFSEQSSDIEEEGNLCLALLMGYNATIYDNGDKERKKQVILDRIYNIMSQLPASLLKMRLLTWGYSETYDEELAHEAHQLIETWNISDLTDEQKEIIEELERRVTLLPVICVPSRTPETAWLRLMINLTVLGLWIVFFRKHPFLSNMNCLTVTVRN